MKTSFLQNMKNPDNTKQEYLTSHKVILNNKHHDYAHLFDLHHLQI